MSVFRPGLVAGALAASLIGSGGCATAGRGRPAPFPTVPASRPAEAPPLAPASLPVLSEVAQVALRYLGVPYRPGGESPDTGFDCSGFVRYVIGLATRYDMPRTVEDQYRLGVRIGDAEIRAGDLVFFSTVAPGASHVGIAIDSGEFVHAPVTNGSVRIEHLEAAYWRDRFVGARRLF